MNLWDKPSGKTDQELLDVLLSRSGVRIERIVSNGQTSPEGFWYDQDEEEWVVVLAGEARLQFEGESKERFLNAGDHCHIAAHQRHRVSYTSKTEPTIWLAVFFPPGG